MTDSRLSGADFVRASACLVVLFHHLAQRMSWNDQLGPVEWFRVLNPIGGYGVAMFFVLSGFLLARPFWLALDAGDRLPSLRIYAMRRAARILPGFWLALIVTFVLSVAVFGARLDAELVLRFLTGLFLVADWHPVTLFPVEINGPLWSISFEVTSYVLLPLGFLALFLLRGRLGAGWRARAAWLAVIAATLAAHWAFATFYRFDPAGTGWDYGLIGGAKTWMPRFNPFGFFAMFAIGALAAGLQVRLSRYRHPAFDIAGLVAIGAAIWMVGSGFAPQHEGYGLLEVPYGFPWFHAAIGGALAALPSSVIVGRALDVPPIRYVAQISFGIYVWHYLVLELVRRFVEPDFEQGGIADPVQFVLVSALITLLSVAIAHLSFRLIEEPAMRWARSREGGRQQAPTLSPAAG